MKTGKFHNSPYDGFGLLKIVYACAAKLHGEDALQRSEDALLLDPRIQAFYEAGTCANAIPSTLSIRTERDIFINTAFTMAAAEKSPQPVIHEKLRELAASHRHIVAVDEECLNAAVEAIAHHIAMLGQRHLQ